MYADVDSVAAILRNRERSAAREASERAKSREAAASAVRITAR